MDASAPAVRKAHALLSRRAVLQSAAGAAVAMVPLGAIAAANPAPLAVPADSQSPRMTAAQWAAYIQAEAARLMPESALRIEAKEHSLTVYGGPLSIVLVPGERETHFYTMTNPPMPDELLKLQVSSALFAISTAGHDA